VAARAAGRIAAIFQALTQNTAGAVAEAVIHLRLRMVVVLSTVLAEVVEAILQEPLQAVLVEHGVRMPVAEAGLVESMMARAVLMDHLGNSAVATEAEAAGEERLLAWALVGMEERQVVVAVEVGGR
jgi:hypothetical protein